MYKGVYQLYLLAPWDGMAVLKWLWLLAIFESLLLINKDDEILVYTSVGTCKCSSTFLDGEDLTASCMCVSGIKNCKIHTNIANMSCAYCIYNLTTCV